MSRVGPSWFNSYRLDSESTDEKVVSIVPSRPRGWRDAWAVLRGRYEPTLERREALTVHGASNLIREHYASRVGDELKKPALFHFERLSKSAANPTKTDENVQ